MDTLVGARLPLLRRSATVACYGSCCPIYGGHLPSSRALFTRQDAFSGTRRSMTTNAHNASQNSDNPSDDSDAAQAHSLSGYYADILNMNSPYRKPALITRPVDQPAEEQTPGSTDSPKSPQDKMSIVFGTRLASPGYRSTRYNPTTTSPESTWRTINGVAIPPRPEEPDNCCMSGCVHCVWDDFRDEMEEWAGRVEHAKAKSEAKTRTTTDMLRTPRREVEDAGTSMDDDGGGSEANWALPDESEDLFAGIPVGIREFMRTEKRLRQKHQHDGATA